MEMAKFVRLRGGSIGLSKQYIESLNNDPEKIIQKFKHIFDINAKFTSKMEPIFCSGVLELFFAKIIKTDDNKGFQLKKYPELQ